MCAYSLNSMNTYSQYILSSDELSRVFSAQNIDFVTSEEVKYKKIIISAIVIGLLLFIAIIATALIVGNKKENNLKFTDKYIRCIGGTLKGNVYKFEGKLVIGRNNSKCNIVYPADEPRISDIHCTVQMVDDACYLVDNFSEYGTFLEDGTKIVSSLPYKIETNRIVFYLAEQKNRFEFIYKKEMKA